MMPPAPRTAGHATIELGAPLARWNLAGRFQGRQKCEQNRLAFRRDGERLAATRSPELKALADAQLHVQCVKVGDQRLDPELNRDLPEPFWISLFDKYPNQTASRVMVSSILIMPPASKENGELRTDPYAPLSEWKYAGDFGTAEECEAKRRTLWHRGRSIEHASGLKPLAAAEMNARCEKPDDPSIKKVLFSFGVFDPPVLDVPYSEYPDEKSPDYVSAQAHYADEHKPTVQEIAERGFPDLANENHSPDGRYVLSDVRNSNPDLDFNGSIFLTDTRTGRKELLYKYDRSIEIVWSPSSTAFVMNDDYGSNVMRALVFVLQPRLAPIDIGEQLLKSDRPRREKESIETADHVYTGAVKWIDNNTVVLRIDGYNGVDQPGFTLAYTYNIRSNRFTLLEYLHHSNPLADRG
ncbi:MAG: hypothetical protein ACLQU2_36085 [Candidatus Binataceae bacterium]